MVDGSPALTVGTRAGRGLVASSSHENGFNRSKPEPVGPELNRPGIDGLGWKGESPKSDG